MRVALPLYFGTFSAAYLTGRLPLRIQRRFVFEDWVAWDQAPVVLVRVLYSSFEWCKSLAITVSCEPTLQSSVPACTRNWQHVAKDQAHQGLQVRMEAKKCQSGHEPGRLSTF